MTRVNIHEAKTHLSRYLKRVARGETILLCKRNVPVAEIRPIAQNARRRPIGLAKGEFKIPKAFYNPLPQELLDYFEGKK
ncbi:MAG: type II toxin-antitoxin system Phd/YefM family antitoxin [Acidobacteria bacterium]|nr:type II toxin-antitoxin system Phd/YefM family antitoxin [Acidobacteriota bacterium]